MSYSIEDLKRFQQRELKSRSDTFRFECQMCGKCCRKRSEPIIVNGSDVFRMSRALGISVEDFIIRNTNCYLGEHSHAPILTLSERLDGSCRMLRKGKCMVQQDKPVVCAIYPLGRYQDSRDNSVHYFLNSNTCIGASGGKEWTLQEWLDAFHVDEVTEMSTAWNELFAGISARMCKLDETSISIEMREVMTMALYFNYDWSRPYIQQIEENKIEIERMFSDKFHIKFEFKERM